MDENGDEIKIINITAHDLVGQTVPSFSIYAANFTVNLTSILESNNDACNTTNAGTFLVNNTNVTVAGSSIPSGNNSQNRGIGKIKMCIKNINIIAANMKPSCHLLVSVLAIQQFIVKALCSRRYLKMHCIFDTKKFEFFVQENICFLCMLEISISIRASPHDELDAFIDELR